MGTFYCRHFTLLFLAWLCTSCAALLCFDCSSVNEQGCGDHFVMPNTYAFNCKGTCLKRRGERRSNEVRTVEVVRTCTEQRQDGCFDDYWNGMTVKACACNTDYCNAAVHSLTTPFSCVSLLLLTVFTGLLGKCVLPS